MRNISPSDVTCFLATAKHGRIAKAAEACQIAQPTLPKAIQRLEAECGLALFERDGRGTRLTAAGESFVKVAESMNRSCEEAVRLARRPLRSWRPMSLARLALAHR